MRKLTHRYRWIVIGAVLASFVFLILWGWVPPTISDANCHLTENGAWISVDWTSQFADEAAVAELAKSASTRQIRYLFPFTTYLKPDGTFSPSYTYAAEFVSLFRRFNQETYLLAWIGIPLQNNRNIGIQGWVDLADETTRGEIVAFVARLVDEAGFDGVHLNVETVQNDDANYLLLLDEVSSALGPRRLLSVASSYWLPPALNELPLVNGYKWSSEYYQAVAVRVDQIAAMTYDSLMPHPTLYRLWLREQVRGISRSLADSDVELLMGISVSRERTMTHRPNAENMQSGLAGICTGLSGLSKTGHKVEGIAIYAAWEAEKADWQTWTDWITASPRKGE